MGYLRNRICRAIAICGLAIAAMTAVPQTGHAGQWATQSALEGAPPEPAETPEDRPALDGLPPEPAEPTEAPAKPSTNGDAEATLEGAPPEPVENATEPEDAAAAAAEPAAPVVLRQYLILRAVDRFLRGPFQQDAIEAAIVSGEWQPPVEGDVVDGSAGIRRKWSAVRAGDDGWIRDAALRGGYAYATFESPREQVLLLFARGNSMVYVNGIPRVGDTYDTGWLQLPVLMQEGKNEFLFHVGRGDLFAELLPPEGEALLREQDVTQPDLVVGEEEPKWAAVWVINASDGILQGAKLISTSADGRTLESDVTPLPPLSVRKVPMQLDGRAADVEEAKRTVQLVTQEADERKVLDEITLTLQVAQPDERHVRTFVSNVDGSVQYYAVQPGLPEGSDKPGLILSLHGAAVEAGSFAEQYTPKSWAHVIAPTNRRPFGFDWEDWGRIDAFEALEDAELRYDIDPRRAYLTGHSMGGHGAWHIAATYPGRFAAVGPSAGWISFDTYTQTATSADDSPIARIFARAANPGDTLELSRNLAAAGVYVLHGSDDENVPVREARTMREELAEFHPDFAYFEKADAGHWWGSESVDWPPMMDFFRRHDLPAKQDVERIDFTTMNPGVSARSGWVTIEAQQRQLEPSRAVIECDADDRRFSGTTANVARLALDVSHLEPESNVRIELDTQRLRDVPWPNVTRKIWLVKEGDRWTTTTPPPPDVKGPERYGLFKDVFRNRAVLVYGTRGNAEENEWALAKARFDAETFLYRGNGALEVVADRDFNPSEYADRNVVLYGNADTNRAWPALLSTCPVQIRRGAVRVGQRAELGTELGCLFIYPRRGSSRASVGVVSGTGVAGMQLTNRLRFFVSGVAYPDLAIFDAEVLSEGAGAIRAAGFFGLDWGIDTGDIAWRDLAL